MSGEQAAAAERIGRGDDARGHGTIGFTGAEHAAERVHGAGIESRCHDDKLRMESLQRRYYDAIEGREIGTVSGPGRQGNVEVGAGRGTGTDNAELAGIDRVAAILMNRDREHGWVGNERALGAIAMMHVPVDHGDSRHAMHALRMAHG
jgi:hypothetical protein